MNRLLIPWLLCISLTAHSQVGSKPAPKPAVVVCPPALSTAQKVRFADSLKTLKRVRGAAQAFRIEADTSAAAATVARRAATGFANSLAVQKNMTNAMVVESSTWKRKARRRGLLNWLLLSASAAAGYYHATH